MREEERGVWSASGGNWEGRWFSYRVLAYHPSTGRVEECETTDPYARVLAANGGRFQARHIACVCRSPLSASHHHQPGCEAGHGGAATAGLGRSGVAEASAGARL